MFELHDPGLWRERREELLREAEDGRLARRLRAARPKKRDLGIRSALIALARRRPPRREEPAEC